MRMEKRTKHGISLHQVENDGLTENYAGQTRKEM